MHAFKFLLLALALLTFAGPCFYLVWREIDQGRQGPRWKSAPGTITFVETKKPQRVFETWVRGHYQSERGEQEFEGIWGKDLPRNERPAVGASVTVWFDPKHPRYGTSRQPETSLWVVAKFGSMGLLSLLSSAMFVWFAFSSTGKRMWRS